MPPLSATTLLEREAPLQALAAARERAQAGGCVALVSGEAGIGKTSLVAAFTESMVDDTLVAVGRCDALFTPRVLGPAHDVASRLGGELRDKLEAGAGRPAIFTAFLDALRRHAEPIVVFEDLHWADEATLDLVKYLGRRISDTRALLVLTYRDDEVDARHPLRMVIGDLPRDRCVRVALAPLSLAAVEGLMAGAKSATAPAAAIHHATGGNAFYVTEIVASSGGIPQSVSDAVLARAARLGPRARAAVELVCVAPGGLEDDIVKGLVEEGAAAIGECEERGVLREQGGMLRFRHEIARLALHETLAPSRRREINLRVLAALQSRAADASQLARLAHHAEAAQAAPQAREYSVAAARRAAALGAHREAADHYVRAVKYAAGMPDLERAELLEACAWECQLTMRSAEAVATRSEALDTWRRLGNTEREAACFGRQAHLLVVLGRNPEGERAIRAALDLLPSIRSEAAHALVHRHHAYIRMLERDVEAAIAAGEKALALAERLDDAETQVHVLNTIGSSMLVADDERGYGLLDRSLALAREHGFDYHVANAYGNLGSAGGEVHRFHRALRDLQEGIAWSQARDLDTSRNYQLSWLALVQLFLGQWAQASDSAQELLRQPAASPIARIMGLLATGRLRARRGDPGVWEALDEALTLSEGTETLQRLAPVRAARAEAAWLDGEDAAAAREAMAADGLARAKSHAWFVGELGYWQWKGGRAVDMPAYAARPYALQVAGRWREAAEDWKARGCPYEHARALAEGDAEGKLEGLRIFMALGAGPAAERVRQSLRASGVRRIPRGPRASTRAQPAGLTRREAQILALVAENFTNAEIGARLHISPKTVDHHVSALLAKLGVTSRREAARAARDLNWVGSPDVVKG